MPKNQYRRIIDSKRAVATVYASSGTGNGGGGGGGGVTDHSLLEPLSLTEGDDHPQYLNVTRGNTLYVPLGRSIITPVGGGVQGGSTLYGNITLTVDNTVVRTTQQVIAGAGLIGGGALAYNTNVTLNVAVSGLGLSVVADAVVLTSSNNPGATPQILATDNVGNVTLASVTTPLVTATASMVIRTPAVSTNHLTLDVGGNIIVAGIGHRVQSAGFASGYTGAGWGAVYGVNGAEMETDDLTVRGTMRVYELLIQQIRSTNGSLLVASSSRVKVVTNPSGNTYEIDTEGTDVGGSDAYHGFLVGDLIRAKRWKFDGTNQAVMYDSKMQVTAVLSLTKYRATLVVGQPPQIGFDYVRHGSATNVNRRGGIYLTADDSGAPYMDIFNGVNQWTVGDGITTIGWDNPEKLKMRVGHLQGVTAVQNEYGMIAGNGFTNADTFVRFSSSTVLLHNVTFTVERALGGSSYATTVSISPAGRMLLGTDVSNPVSTTFDFTATSGALRIGPGSGGAYLYWTGSNAPANRLEIRNSNNVAVVRLDNLGGAYFAGIVNIASTGELRQGIKTDPPLPAPPDREISDPILPATFAGIRMWNSNGEGYFGGYSYDTARRTEWLMSRFGYNLREIPVTDSPPTVKHTIAALNWWVDPLSANGITLPRSRIYGYSANSGASVGVQIDILPVTGPSLWLSRDGGTNSFYLNNVDQFQGLRGLYILGNSTTTTIYLGKDGGSPTAVTLRILAGTNISVEENWTPAYSAALDLSNGLDIGTAQKYWRRLYVREIVGASVGGGGGTLTGLQTWQYDAGNMYVVSNSPVDRRLELINSGGGRMDLYVPDDIFFNDGYAVGDLRVLANNTNSNLTAHVNNSTVHFRAHLLDGTDHQGSLSWSRVAKVGSRLVDIETRDYADLDNRTHDLITEHTAGATLTVGHVLRATSASVFGFGTITSSVVSDFATAARGSFSASAPVNINAGVISITLNGVTTAYLPLVAQYTIMARSAAGTGNYENLTLPAFVTMLNTATGLNADTTDGVHLRGTAGGQIIVSATAAPYTGAWTALTTLSGKGVVFSATNTIDINLASPSGLEIVSDFLQIADATAGNGLTIAGKILAVGAGVGITVAANDVAVNTAYAFTWSASHTFQATLNIGHMLPITTNTYDIGSSAKMHRQLYVSNITATVFAQYTTQLVGGWLVVPKYSGNIKTDMPAPATQGAGVVSMNVDLGVANVGGANPPLKVGHFLQIRAHNIAGAVAVEFLKVTAWISGTTWTVQRNLNNATRTLLDWPAGVPYMNMGYYVSPSDTDGWLEFNATDTPRFSMFKFISNAYTGIQEFVRIGDLNGMPGFVTLTWGVFIGDADQNLRYDPTNGLIINGSGSGLTDIDGGAIRLTSSIAIGSSATYGSAGFQVQDIGAGLGARLYVGNGIADATATARFLRWDGQDITWKAYSSELKKSGAMTLKDGSIAGWQFDANAFYDDPVSGPELSPIALISAGYDVYGARLRVGDLASSTARAGIAAYQSTYAATYGNIAFWAGQSSQMRHTAPFRVTHSGAVVATSISLAGGAISGTFTVSPPGKIVASYTTINDLGITIVVDTTYNYNRAYTFTNTVEFSGIRGASNSTTNYIQMYVGTAGAALRTPVIDIRADGTVANPGQLGIYALGNSTLNPNIVMNASASTMVIAALTMTIGATNSAVTVQGTTVVISSTNFDVTSGGTVTVAGSISSQGRIVLQRATSYSYAITSAGWKRIAKFIGTGGRGDGQLTVRCTGGAVAPFSMYIMAAHGYTINTGTLVATSGNPGGVFSQARITWDDPLGEAYVELYAPGTSGGTNITFEAHDAGAAWIGGLNLYAVETAGGDTVEVVTDIVNGIGNTHNFTGRILTTSYAYTLTGGFGTGWMFNGVPSIGLFGSANIVGITGHNGEAVLYNSVTNVDSYIRLGFGNPNTRNAYIDLFAAPNGTGASYQTRLIRNAGTDGNFVISNLGTGGIYLYTGGTNRLSITTIQLSGDITTVWDTPDNTGQHRWRIAGSTDYLSIAYVTASAQGFVNLPSVPLKFTALGTAPITAAVLNNGAEAAMYWRNGRIIIAFRNSSNVVKYLKVNTDLRGLADGVVAWALDSTVP